MPFSPRRSSNGHHASYLLRAVAQLRSQLRAHLPQARPAPSQRPCAWRWLGGILLGPVVWTKCPRLGLVALCEAEEAPPTYSRPYVGESRFNWKLFWQFLRPHLLVLGVAIVVSCPSMLPRQGQGRSQSGVCEHHPELHGDSLSASPNLKVRPQEAARAGWLGELEAKGYQEILHGTAGCAGSRGPQGLAAWALTQLSQRSTEVAKA